MSKVTESWSWRKFGAEELAAAAAAATFPDSCSLLLHSYKQFRFSFKKLENKGFDLRIFPQAKKESNFIY